MPTGTPDEKLPPGRPRKYDRPRMRITVELPEEVVQQVDAAARRTQVTRTALIERALRQWIETIETDERG